MQRVYLLQMNGTSTYYKRLEKSTTDSESSPSYYKESASVNYKYAFRLRINRILSFSGTEEGPSSAICPVSDEGSE